NNLYWKTGGSPVVQNAGGSTVDATSKKVAPVFASPGGDFHLTASSPAIDAGSNESLNAGYTRDLEDRQVPAGSAVDMGAYEFGAVAANLQGSHMAWILHNWWTRVVHVAA